MTRKTANSASAKPPKEATNVILSKSSAGKVERKPDASPESSSRPDGSMGPGPVTAKTRQLMIAEAAYYMSERRGFGAGREIDDWLLAEKQVDAALSGEPVGAQAT